MTFQGEEVAAGDTFTVVTNSFLAAGGDNFITFAEGTDRTDTGQIDLSASVAYFAAHDVVDPNPLGRAAIADDEPTEPTEPTQPTEPVEPTTPVGSGEDDDNTTGELAVTGGEFPIGFVTVAALALIVAGALLAIRRRQTA